MQCFTIVNSVHDLLGGCVLTIIWRTDRGLPYAVFHYSKLCMSCWEDVCSL